MIQIQTRHLLWFSYIFTFLNFVILYFIIGNRFGTERSPLQPDSWIYLCRAIDFSGINENDTYRLLSELSARLGDGSMKPPECGDTPVAYKGRILLPILLVPFIAIGQWWLIGFPNLLAVLVLVKIWFLMMNSGDFITFRSAIFLFLPLVSIQIFPQMLLVLSDTFTVLGFFLAILLSRRMTNSIAVIPLVMLVEALMMLSRQSWPFFVACNIYISLFLARQISVRQRLLFLAPFISFPLFWGQFWDGEASSSFMASVNLRDYFSGIMQGLGKDFIDTLKYLDFGTLVIVLVLLFNLLRIQKLKEDFLLLSLIAVSLAIQGRVFVADGSFGQNWRYWLIPLMYSQWLFLERIFFSKTK